jgi:copper chaperone CopZ
MHTAPSSTTSPTRQVDLAIDGMNCGHCVAAVRTALAELPGVEIRQVAIGAASVAIDPTHTSVDALISAVDSAGYAACVSERPLPQADAGRCCSTRPN